MAFIYIGTILDQSLAEIQNALRKELASDQNSAIEARQIALEWGLVPSVTDTNPFLHAGYKLASRLLRYERPLIDALAEELCAKGAIDEQQLGEWFEAHAQPLSLEELEASTTY